MSRSAMSAMSEMSELSELSEQLATAEPELDLAGATDSSLRTIGGHR